MRRVLIPALAGILLTVGACGAGGESASNTPTSPAALAADSELETITITVLGMG